MTGSIGAAWEFLPDEVWEPLASYSRGGQTAPPDVFSDLFVATDEFVAPSHPRRVLEHARNDPRQAREQFLELRSTDFASESFLVLYLEEVYPVLDDYGIAGLADHYVELLSAAIRKLDLRYRAELGPRLRLRFLLPGSFANLYDEIEHSSNHNPHLARLLEDFEKAFDEYARTEDDSALRTCLARASNFAEGLASATYGSSGTLGFLCRQLRDWPHEKLRQALIDIYHFTCDYPGIRHAGTPGSDQRTLDARDLTIVTLLFMTFTGYLAPMNKRGMLGI